MPITSATQVMVETRFSATTVPSSVVVGGRLVPRRSMRRAQRAAP